MRKRLFPCPQSPLTKHEAYSGCGSSEAYLSHRGQKIVPVCSAIVPSLVRVRKGSDAPPKISPLQGLETSSLVPRAMPWAIASRPFRADRWWRAGGGRCASCGYRIPPLQGGQMVARRRERIVRAPARYASVETGGAIISSGASAGIVPAAPTRPGHVRSRKRSVSSVAATPNPSASPHQMPCAPPPRAIPTK